MRKRIVIACLLVVVIAIFLSLATRKGWVVWPFCYEARFYDLDMPGHSITKRIHTESVAVWFNLREDVALRIFADCSNSHGWLQDKFFRKDFNPGCALRIFFEAPAATKIELPDESQFTLEGVDWLNTTLNIDTDVTVFKTKKQWLHIHWSDEKPLQKFRLIIPALKIDGKPYTVPAITGERIEEIICRPPAVGA